MSEFQETPPQEIGLEKGIVASLDNFESVRAETWSAFEKRMDELNAESDSIFSKYIDSVSDDLPEAILIYVNESPADFSTQGNHKTFSFSISSRHYILPKTKEVYTCNSSDDPSLNPNDKKFIGFEEVRKTLPQWFKSIDNYAAHNSRGTRYIGPYWKSRLPAFKEWFIDLVEENFSTKQSDDKTEAIASHKRFMDEYNAVLDKDKNQLGELRLQSLFELIDSVSTSLGEEYLPNFIKGEGRDYDYVLFPKVKKFRKIDYDKLQAEGIDIYEEDESLALVDDESDEINLGSQEEPKLKEIKEEYTKEASAIEAFDNLNSFADYVVKLLPGYDNYIKQENKAWLEAHKELATYKPKNKASSLGSTSKEELVDSLKSFIKRRKLN